jgi:hypothetical protein
VPYFHVVFKLPAAIGAIAYQNKAKVYGLLLKAAAETVTTIAADRKHLGAHIGVTGRRTKARAPPSSTIAPETRSPSMRSSGLRFEVGLRSSTNAPAPGPSISRMVKARGSSSLVRKVGGGFWLRGGRCRPKEEDDMRATDPFTRIPKWMATPGMLIAVALGTHVPAGAGGPNTSIQTEYLMTLHAILGPAQAIDRSLYIGNAGGWVEGPGIKGKLVEPSGDWFRVMPSGILRLDARLTIQTDDGELIFMSFNGVVQCSKEQWDRLAGGEELKTGDCYYIVAPTFETKSEKYGWINAIQAVGKASSIKSGDHLDQDIFAVK